MTVSIGSNVLIPCVYSGVGSILPFWRHNQETFYSLNLPSLKYSFNHLGLTIHNITLAMNMDRYSCFVALFSGNVVSTVGVITVTQTRVLSSVNGSSRYYMHSITMCVCACIIITSLAMLFLSITQLRMQVYIIQLQLKAQ